MPRSIDWEGRIGRRLRLRDLYVFFAVVQWSSMAKAAKQLGISQPAVSAVIAALESELGVTLLDRSPKGVQTTPYGRALLTRAHAAFDELRQGVKDIEFLNDPNSGELRMGCPDSITAGLLPPLIAEFARDFPKVTIKVDQMPTPTLEFPELRARKLDFVVARLQQASLPEPSADELAFEWLFDDEFVVVGGTKSRWARQRTLDFASLAEAAWILPPENTWGQKIVEDAFQARGLPQPKVFLSTFSIPLRTHLMTMGDFLTVIPLSVLQLYGERFGIIALPVRLPRRPWPTAIVTLKHRALTPVAGLFLTRLRSFVASRWSKPQI